MENLPEKSAARLAAPELFYFRSMAEPHAGQW
jgi:hypothetical protein